MHFFMLQISLILVESFPKMLSRIFSSNGALDDEYKKSHNECLSNSVQQRIIPGGGCIELLTIHFVPI